LKAYEKLDLSATTPSIHRKQAFSLTKSCREAHAIPMMEELLTDNPREKSLYEWMKKMNKR